MRIRTMLILVCVFCNAVISAQEQMTTTPIISENDIVYGGLYLMTFKNSSKKYSLFEKNITKSSDGINVYGSRTKAETTNINNTIDNSTLVQFIKKDGHVLMRDIKDDVFLSMINDLSDFNTGNSVNEDFYCTFSGSGNNFDILIGRKYIRYDYDAHFYSLRSKTVDSRYKRVLLFRVDGYKTDRVLNLDESTDMDYRSICGNISLNRTFLNDIYNTLMLPFNVNDYKSIFGANTTAYKIKSATNDNVRLSKVDENEILYANTPYLIRGEFNAKPYIFENVMITNESDEDGIATKAIGTLNFNGVYKTGKDLGKTFAFIQWQNEFYNCEKAETMPISLFRWYITEDQSIPTESFKTLSIDENNKDNTTEINIPNKNISDNYFYNFNGTRMTGDWNSLPKGIYINGKKKLVKP